MNNYSKFIKDRLVSIYKRNGKFARTICEKSWERFY